MIDQAHLLLKAQGSQITKPIAQNFWRFRFRYFTVCCLAEIISNVDAGQVVIFGFFQFTVSQRNSSLLNDKLKNGR
jgi:hypothetical protein